MLVFPPFLAACNPPDQGTSDLCSGAQTVVIELQGQGGSSAEADDAYDDLVYAWAKPGTTPFGDSRTQQAAEDMITEHERGNVVAYGAAKKTFDYYVLKYCKYDVSLAELP